MLLKAVIIQGSHYDWIKCNIDSVSRDKLGPYAIGVFLVSHI